MANWLESAFGLGETAEPIAPSRKPRLAPKVESFWCVVAQPSGVPGDLGQTVACHYVVTDGVLRLCDERGRGDGIRHVLAAGEEPRRVASRMQRVLWQQERPAFNRPLRYGPSEVI